MNPPPTQYYPAPSAPPATSIPVLPIQYQYTYAQMPPCMLCNQECSTRFSFPCRQEHYVHQECYQYHIQRSSHTDQTKCLLCESIYASEPDPPFIGGVVLYSAVAPSIIPVNTIAARVWNRKQFVCASICCITIIAASILPILHFFLK